MQDAINQIVGIMDSFYGISQIGIVHYNHIIVYYHYDVKVKKGFETVFKEDYFVSPVDLLEWCEKNLKSKT